MGRLSKALTCRVLAIGLLAGWLVSALVFYSWELLDDLIDDELIMFAIVSNDAPTSQNPMHVPLPGWFKDHYWAVRGRQKLAIRFSISPETREIARLMIERSSELGWSVDEDRMRELCDLLERRSSKGESNVVCRTAADPVASICSIVEGARALLPRGRVRIQAVFVPDARHGAYFTDPRCPDVVVPATFPDRRKLGEFFDAAYSGGGATTKLKVDATVTSGPAAEGDGQGMVLTIEQIHAFSDISVIRPPRPGDGP